MSARWPAARTLRKVPRYGGVGTVPINRRVFLQNAGPGAAATALVSCAGAQTASPLQHQPSAAAGAAHPPIDFPALARKLGPPTHDGCLMDASRAAGAAVAR